ncbi:NADH dehydrogenase ubiquinone Fe-S protein 4 [Phenylobacterium sp.]|uniref:NADH dehydrogenase ubiquinone Fe-S protein 4 n=1 Tax=Phenylobacterium sp. TaxID=1871053 RepID=UPI0039C9324E
MASPSPTRLPTARIASERGGRWVLTFERETPPELDPLTGWTISTDPLSQIRLTFPDVQSALGFAERKGWRYEVAEAPAGGRSIHLDHR